MIVSTDEALELMKEKDLQPVSDIWHYSFNIEQYYEYFDFLQDDHASFLIAPKKLHQWAPLPIFTNKPDDENLTRAWKGTNRFWFCRLTTFDDFLNRRSTMSRMPRKHFPTLQTFPKKDAYLQGKLSIEFLDIPTFQEIYDNLKREEHISGKEVLDSLFRSNIGTPHDWFKMMTLEVKKSIVGVGLLVDDGRSQSLINLATIIDLNRYGLYMLTLWIKECCAVRYKSVDAGISGTYGIYKDQIFIDSVFERLPYKINL